LHEAQLLLNEKQKIWDGVYRVAQKTGTFFVLLNFIRLGNSLQGGPKKVSHYRESSLNRIKNRQPG